jgi:hypothetical protein
MQTDGHVTSPRRLYQKIPPAPWLGGVQGQLVLRCLQGQWKPGSQAWPRGPCGACEPILLTPVYTEETIRDYIRYKAIARSLKQKAIIFFACSKPRALSLTSPRKTFPSQSAATRCPVAVAFASTTHRSQGAVMYCLLISLHHPVFTLGQVYVDRARVKDRSQVRKRVPDKDIAPGRKSWVTTNVVLRKMLTGSALFKRLVAASICSLCDRNAVFSF